MSQLFPDKIDGGAVSSKAETVTETVQASIEYSDLAIMIKHFSEVAAACAVVGDIDMAKAFVEALTPIVNICMIRFPEQKDWLSERIPVVDVVEPVGSEEDESTTISEGDMQ